MTDTFEPLKTALADRYTIERELGAGGMATVYMAEDLKHKRKVAVKVLRPELAAVIGAERFLSEIGVTANLRHPNILPLFDSGEADGFLYYVMPVVEGESLRERLSREKRLPIDAAIQYAREVADALGSAHSHGVIHRDVKPDNIFIDQGHAVIADFGIALALDAGRTDRITETGLSLGTPHYMSPEQAAGDRNLDGRSDLYALACVLYEMLAGEPPFSGPTAQAVIVKHVSQQAPSVAVMRDVVPEALDQTLRRALAKTPADRFDTIGEFAEAVVASASSSTPLTSGQDAVQSIAVLPFENLGAGADDEYFSDGMTEEIINALTQLPGLKVTARTSVFAFKGKHEDIRRVAATLGVKTVLEGSVRRVGTRIRITAQLVDADDGYHLWSERFDRDMNDVFELQDEIARCIAERMQVTLGTLSSEQLVKPPTENLAAYELYLKGRFAWERLAQEEARTLFERALEVDANFALAHCGLAMTYNLAYAIGTLAPNDSAPRAEAAARRALEIDDTVAEAHAELAWTEMAYRRDWDAAERECDRSAALNPGYFNSYRIKALLRGYIHGRFDEGLEQNAKGLEIDPLNPLLIMDRGFLLAGARRFDEALQFLRPEFDAGRANPLACYVLGLSYARLGRPEEAREIAATTANRFEDAHRIFALMVEVEIGAHAAYEEAQQRYEQLVAARQERYVQTVLLAWIAGFLGRLQEAFAYLEEAYEQRDGIMWLIKYHPASDPIRADPRFDELIKRVDFPPTLHETKVAPRSL